MIWLYIAAGGAAGAMARYGIGTWVQERMGNDFPWGTLAVNVIGSLAVGFALHYLEAARFTAETRALLVIGLLGAFTTFSTFSHETLVLIQAGALPRAALYTIGSVGLGLLAVYAGTLAAGLAMAGRP